MKPDNIYAAAEFTRASTPLFWAGGALIIILCAVFNSERLVGDRFAYAIGAAGGFLGSAAGGFSPQQRQPQNRINADQVDIDQSK